MGLTFDLDFSHTDLNINRDHLIIKDYLPAKFEASRGGGSFIELSVAQGVEGQLYLDLWPTDLNINRDHLLLKDYLPTKFVSPGAKRVLELPVAQGVGDQLISIETVRATHSKQRFYFDVHKVCGKLGRGKFALDGWQTLIFTVNMD